MNYTFRESPVVYIVVAIKKILSWKETCNWKDTTTKTWTKTLSFFLGVVKLQPIINMESIVTWRITQEEY